MFKTLNLILVLAGFSALGVLPPSGASTAVPGTLNYVEGQLEVASQPVTSRSAGSIQLEPNQTIATTQGKAEVLLTPGVFLRIGDDSSVRLVSNNLADIRVELQRGEALVEANQVFDDSNIRVMLDGASVKLVKRGLYRFDAEPGKVSVLDGKALVERDDRQVDLKKGREVRVTDAALKPSKFDSKAIEEHDPLYAWSRLRSEYDAEASRQSASVIAVGGPGWWGPGCYWNSGWGMYSYLPGDGMFYSPFGWPYYSPGFVYVTPGFRYGYGRFNGHGFYGHGPVGRGFDRGRINPSIRSGGFAGRSVGLPHSGGFGGHQGFRR